ncbi:MAG: FGGY family carbohydrate kinase [Sphaerochaetaceae bacterium]
MDKVHIGLCIGTTNTTLTALNLNRGEVVKSRSLASQRIDTQEAYSYCQDSHEIERVVGELLDSVDEPWASLTVTGQVHGILYYDKQGKALSPLYTWLDQRGLVELEGITSQQLLYQKGGVLLPSGYGFLTHYANVRMGKVPAGAVGFCGILEYITGRLIDQPLTACDTSTLATYGGWSVVERRFQQNLLNEVTNGLFLTPAPPFSIAGYTQEGVTVACPVGDNQAGFLAMVESWEDTALVNVGTSGQISFFSRSAEGSPTLELRPFFDQGFLHVGATLTAGKAYENLQSFVKEILHAAGLAFSSEQVYALMERVAKEETSLVVDPRFSGSRLEAWRRGSIENITLDNFSLGDLVLATVDGVIDELLNFNSHCVEEIVATGSAFLKNRLFVNALVKKFPGVVTVAPLEDGAGLGAAIIGALATQELSLDNLPNIVQKIIGS